MDNLRSMKVSFLDNSLVLIGFATAVYSLGFLYYSEARKLRKFPSVGPTLPILSYIGTFKFFKDAQQVVETGIRKWNHIPFKVPALFGWWVVVTEPRLIDDLRKAPENQLSCYMILDDFLQTQYTFGLEIHKNPYHVQIVKSQLTRSLPKLVPEMHDEIIYAFTQHIPPMDDWSSVKIFEIAMKIILQTSNRVFVGLPLCRNPDWLNLNIQHSKDVISMGFLLRFFPPFLRPLVNSVVSNVPKRNREGLRFLAPLIAARLKERKERGDNHSEKPLDILSWLMDEADESERDDPQKLVIRIFALFFFAVHTSSLTFTYALFYVALFPEYLELLREEVDQMTRRAGWTKVALDQMINLDSFIKESQRLHPIGTVMLNRLAVNDFTFSDGTTVPAGTTLAVPLQHIHLDAETYEDPMNFDGLRFVRMKERTASKGESDKKFDMVSTSLESLAFGSGQHACPGRFFAAVEVKLMLAYAVMNYDLKLIDGVRPPDKKLMHVRVQDDMAEVLFRKRKYD